MNIRRTFCLLLVLLAVAIFGTWRGNAFALLGPFQPWMQPTNGLDQPGDIGGPMCISNGYRWNVPLVTYGFDKSFINFFGSNGEAAVESAIQIVNNLPPASQLDLTAYPVYSMESDYTAEEEGLLDLKSWTLPLLLEQMGLASPSRYVFVLKQWNPIFNSDSSESEWPDWVYPDDISDLNFDPQTHAASHYVDSTLYIANITTSGDQNELLIMPDDPYSLGLPAVADGLSALGEGAFYLGLTRDDVGGLDYLISTNNIAYETLLPGVTGAGTNVDFFVNGAWRPGIDKITFVPQPTDPQSGDFLATTNYYTDTYFTNGACIQQQLARVILKPDLLFSAARLAQTASLWVCDRTGTTNWINNAALNGNPGGGGPGVITPPIKITFNKLGSVYYTDQLYTNVQTDFEPQGWASFNGSADGPVYYPIAENGSNEMTMHLILSSSAPNIQKSFAWKECSASGTQYLLQSSADLSNWATVFTVTNNGTVCTFFVNGPFESDQYFRLIQEP